LVKQLVLLGVSGREAPLQKSWSGSQTITMLKATIGSLRARVLIEKINREAGADARENEESSGREGLIIMRNGRVGEASAVHEHIAVAKGLGLEAEVNPEDVTAVADEKAATLERGLGLPTRVEEVEGIMILMLPRNSATTQCSTTFRK